MDQTQRRVGEMMTFKQSPVVFTEKPHGYHLGDKELMGITGLIHDVLGLGYGDDTPENVKNYYIPRASEYGHAVHAAIENYDKMGIKMTRWHKSDAFGTDDWDVSRELDNYIKNRNGFTPLFNEFTISDEERYASNIDNGWQMNETQGIWLVDTKTNNLKYYPGGKSGLKEYLSWQLSIYAYLFERQTGYNVEGLACNWLRGEDSDFWVIDRKPDEDVELLLSTPWKRFGDKIEYSHEQGDAIKAKYYAPAKRSQSSIVSQEIINAVADLLQQQAEVSAKVDKFKELLRDAMDKAGVKSIDNDRFKVTLGEPTVQMSFDSKRFKDDDPETFAKYTKTISKKGQMKITLK